MFVCVCASVRIHKYACVCVYVCVWKVWTDVKLRAWACNFYIIFIIARGHRGPGGPLANEDAHRVPWKRTCVTHLDGLYPLSWGHNWWSHYIYIYIYVCMYVCIYIYTCWSCYLYVSSYMVACFRDSVPIGSLYGSFSNLVCVCVRYRIWHNHMTYNMHIRTYIYIHTCDQLYKRIYTSINFILVPCAAEQRFLTFSLFFFFLSSWSH